MKTQFMVNFPAELAYGLRMQEQEFAEEMKKLALVKLFELGKISSGIAAKALNISRIDFFDVLASYGVDMFNDIDAETLKQERHHA